MAELSDCNKLCVFLLSVLGLWPYGSRKYRLLKNIFISISLWIGILVQILPFTTMEMTLYHTLSNLSIMTVAMGSLVKYHVVWYEADIVKGLTDRMKFHLQTENDVILQIMQKHNSLGKQLSTFFASSVYSSAGVMILYHLSPIILDKIAPLNESRPIKYPVDVEFVFVEESNPISATIYYLCVAVTATVYVGTESLTIMIGLHTTSLFEVTCYYFQTAVSIEVTNSCIPRKYTNIKNMRYLIESVIMHKETIEFCSNWSTYLELTYMPMILLGVLSLTINLFFLSQSVLHSSNFGEAIFYLLLVIGTVQYMFLINLAIQYVLDGAANISMTIYNTSWYETSVATQKLLQMVILESNRDYTISVYSIFDASLRGFSVLFRTSLSYFMMLVSL